MNADVGDEVVTAVFGDGVRRTVMTGLINQPVTLNTAGTVILDLQEEVNRLEAELRAARGCGSENVTDEYALARRILTRLGISTAFGTEKLDWIVEEYRKWRQSGLRQAGVDWQPRATWRSILPGEPGRDILVIERETGNLKVWHAKPGEAIAHWHSAWAERPLAPPWFPQNDGSVDSAALKKSAPQDQPDPVVEALRGIFWILQNSFGDDPRICRMITEVQVRFYDRVKDGRMV